MTTTDKVRERAKQLASEAHCRYCDRRGDPRLKCYGDIDLMAKDIADAILEFRREVLDEVAKMQCPGCFQNWPIEKMDHLDIHIDKIGNKRACTTQAIRRLGE